MHKFRGFYLRLSLKYYNATQRILESVSKTRSKALKFDNLQKTQIVRNDDKAPKLAIVIPCYNEEAVIAHTYKALCKKLDSLIAQNLIAKDSFLCFVDDGSVDKTCEILLFLKGAENHSSQKTQKEQGSPVIANNQTKQAGRVIASEQSERGNPLKNKVVDCHENPNGFSRNDKLAGITCRNDNANPPHKILKLTRNYGHQNALLAGLEYVKDKCDCVVSIDSDLQQDINAIDEMLFKFKNGADIVYGVRKAYTSEGAFKKYTSFGFYKFMQIMGVKILYNHADYRLLSARACEALLEFREVNLFLRGIVPLVGYKSAVVHYEQSARIAGESKYPLTKMLGFALNGITSFSITPLRMMSVVGVVLCVLSVIYGGYAIFVKLFTESTLEGWTSTILILLFFGGMQFLGLGIMGEYIGKIYAEVKHRPRYFVEAVL